MAEIMDVHEVDLHEIATDPVEEGTMEEDVDPDVDSDIQHQVGKCFTIKNIFSIMVSFITIAISAIFVANMDEKYSVNLRIWCVTSLICSIINNIHTYHRLLRQKFQFFVLQRKCLKYLYSASCLCNIVLLVVAIICGANVSIVSDNILHEDEYSALFYMLYVYQCLSVLLLVSVLSVLAIIMSILLCCNEPEQLDGAKSESIARNTVIKTFQDWVGISTTQCSICFEEYTENQKISKLPCGHFYHQYCIEKWLKRSRLCPYCRQEISNANDLHDTI